MFLFQAPTRMMKWRGPLLKKESQFFRVRNLSLTQLGRMLSLLITTCALISFLSSKQLDPVGLPDYYTVQVPVRWFLDSTMYHIVR